MSKVGLLQFDPTVGDLEQNVLRLSTLATQAKEAGATVGISTELAVCGYPPRDLLMERDFVERSMTAALNMSSSGNMQLWFHFLSLSLPRLLSLIW